MAESNKKLAATVKPLVPAPLAGIASLILPGLGQALTQQAKRGIVLLTAFGTTVALFVWRLTDLAHREPTLWKKLGKAYELNATFVTAVIVFLVLMWLAIAWDAYHSAKVKRRGGFAVFVSVIAVFFALGWQISQIDLVKMVKEAPDALPPLSRVLWPWKAAITYKTDTVSAAAQVLTGTEFELPPLLPHKEGEPYLEVSPRRGELSQQDSQGNIIPGTTIHITGHNFKPNTVTQIWWVDPIGNEFRIRNEGKYVDVETDNQGNFKKSIVMPYRLIPPSSEGPLVHRVEARQISQSGPPLPSEPLRLTIGRMIETIFMGMMATFFGIIFSIPISFLAARNIMRGSAFTMVIYYLTRTVLNIVRSIEPLIWALIAVVWVGLGPFAGIVALTLHSIAALGKLYSEAIEGIDHGPIEAIQATGANSLQTIMFGVIPQMISPFISFSIYRWDINVRMSTVIGLVGGGGIGFLLVQYIRLLDYRAAGIAVWFIAVTVAILDYVSAEIRARMT